jgi:hypothetical protein
MTRTRSATSLRLPAIPLAFCRNAVFSLNAAVLLTMGIRTLATTAAPSAA